jgi:uncharacterized membrane protein YbaN (DUF454 family)
MSAAGGCFVLGLLGAILPGLPATPFLLLTSYFLVRTSPRLNRALLRSRLFGAILRDWQRHQGIRRGVKRKAILIVLAAVAATLYFSELSAGWKWGIAAAAVVGLAVVLRLPVLTDPPHDEGPRERGSEDRPVSD